jgi:hypothetical protein
VVRSSRSLAGLCLRIYFTHQTQESRYNYKSPPNSVKSDRTLIQYLPSKSKHLAMLSTMIGLGQNLKKYKDFGLLRP